MENPGTALNYTDLVDSSLSVLNRLSGCDFLDLWSEGSLDSRLLIAQFCIWAENDKLKLSESIFGVYRKQLNDCLDFVFERISKSELEARFKVTESEAFTVRDALETAIEDHNNRIAEFKKLALRINPDYPKIDPFQLYACLEDLYPDLSQFSE